MLLDNGAMCTITLEANINPYTMLVKHKEICIFEEPGNQLEFELHENDQGTETSSKSSVRISVKRNRYGLYFSIPSNLLFLFGSICYAILSILDLEWENDYYSSQDIAQDDDGTDDDNAGSLTKVFDFYVCTSLIGASLFVLNAVVDICQCWFLQKSNLKRVFCRQEFLSSASAALLFGCAAMLDLMNSILANVFSRYSNYNADGCMNIVSAHLYLMSAICAMIMNSNTGGDVEYSTCSTHEMLNVAGDAMFMIGSLIDVVISYISDPDIVASNQHILLGLGMMSSVLWVIDALFYLVADIFFWKEHYVAFDENGEEGDDDCNDHDDNDDEESCVQLPLLVQETS